MKWKILKKYSFQICVSLGLHLFLIGVFLQSGIGKVGQSYNVNIRILDSLSAVDKTEIDEESPMALKTLSSIEGRRISQPRSNPKESGVGPLPLEFKKQKRPLSSEGGAGVSINPANMQKVARLIVGSVVSPQYTEEAALNEYEDIIIVQVLVDEDGLVDKVKLETSVMFGMERAIIRAAQQAKFEPMISREGVAIASWYTLKFDLKME